MAARNRGIRWLRTVPTSFLLSYTLDHVGTVKVDRKSAQPVTMGSAIAEGVRSIIRNDFSRDVSQESGHAFPSSRGSVQITDDHTLRTDTQQQP
ncbi:hypothetical protein BKA59DRAFT_468590 [Fusarium tricinctum]|jgi:hypothetical protein|uniref:Uncharacterized protein n=1 Tax=Fusarium tricinctum TaxID=61284 RepID=A0A8K0S7M3_9HYPO|nr:hypothetical protein BKA59DRAFT_468590 [Fusarium tricinctum]